LKVVPYIGGPIIRAILVTGGADFIGSALVRLLLAETGFRVAGLIV
jgi:nucleoside-diphosphate-sugar epimerase